MSREFRQVDVFTTTPYLGNPVAVVHDADGLDTEAMARFARWTNLSETTFLLPPTSPEADYRVRIFTPVQELPFAGHPTLGTCHAWLEAGGSGKRAGVVVQECTAGLIPIHSTADGLAFEAPPLVRSGAVDDALVDHIAEVLGIERGQIVDSEWVDNGPGWVAVMLESAGPSSPCAPGSSTSISAWSGQTRRARRPRSRFARSSRRTGPR
jgi:PhzF family phenazine biosynthesis protein